MMMFSYKIQRPIDFIRYDIPYGIRNLWTWFSVVWNYRSWDYHYTLIMIRKGLEEMYPDMKDGCHVGCEKEAHRIKICINLLNRIINNESLEGNFTYHENVFMHHDRKWGDFNFDTDEAYKDDMIQCRITRDNIKTKEEQEQEEKEAQELYKRESYMIQQDWDLLFKIMKKYGRKWWD